LVEPSSGVVRIVACASHGPELIPFGWTPCRFGGHRPHFACPRCARRCRKLYGLPRMVCRRCLGLPYQSTRRRRAGRQFDQANVIRTALGGAPGCVHPFPLRPHGMHKTTYARLRHRALALEEAALVHYATGRRPQR
jgi:hypothetical protein